MARNGRGRATLIIERVNDAEDHLCTALSALRLEYLMTFIRKHRLQAEIDYDVNQDIPGEFTVFITLSPEEMVMLLEAAYYAGLGHFYVELEEGANEALFDRIKQFEVAYIESKEVFK